MEYKISKKGRDDDALLLRLPENLISHILLRLPIESISCCKCVCKTLEKILRDPHFAEHHLTNATEADKRLIIQKQYDASSLFLFHVVDPHNTSALSPKSSYHNDCAPRLWKEVSIPPIISQLEGVEVSVVGTCNGLLCLAYSIEKNDILYVCNPILGEFLLLPKVPKPKPGATFGGFGFCPKTKQYKVVRFGNYHWRSQEDKAYGLTRSSYCAIHTLGTNGWRLIGNVNPPLVRICPTHLNGNLYWLAESGKLPYVICSFNLETEQVSHIPLPAHFNQGGFRLRADHLQVGVLGELLCFSYLLGRNQFEVFVMKNSDENDSWTRQSTVDIDFGSGLPATSGHASSGMKFKRLRDINFLDNGEFVASVLIHPSNVL